MDEPTTGKSVLFYVVGGVLLSGLIAAMAFWPSEQRLDRETLCPVEGAPSARVTVVLVDRTDPLTVVQQQHAMGLLSEYVTQSAPAERIVIYAIDAKREIELSPLVKCNPNKAEVSVFDQFSDKDFEAKRHKEQFVDPLLTTMQRLLPTQETTQTDSPIMEMIQAVAVRDLGGARSSRLVVLSDLMQHSQRFSLYRDPADPRRFLNSDAFKVLGAELNRTDVTLLLVGRTQGRSKQPPGIEELWQSYFSAQNAKSVVIRRVRGEGW